MNKTTQTSLLNNKLFIFLFISISYYLFAKLGQLVAIAPGNVTPIWPPSGIAFAALIFFDKRAWSGVFFGAFLGNVHAFFNVNSTHMLVISIIGGLIIALGSLLQPIIGKKLLSKHIKDFNFFITPNAFAYFVVIIPVFCLTSSTIGTLSLLFTEIITIDNYFNVWLTWWLGDSVGVLIFTPLIYLVVKSKYNFKHIKEALPAFIILLFISLFSFGFFFTKEDIQYPLAFLPFPFLIYFSYKYKLFPVYIAVTIIVLIATIITISGKGPFVIYDTNLSLLLLQSFIITVIITSIMLSLFVQQQNEIEYQLETKVDERTKELKFLAQHDPLTGLFNRITLEGEINKTIIQFNKHNAPFALLMLDIDWFKKTNDKYGHDIGDYVLAEIAKLLTHTVRPDDKVFRVGGEEFVVLLNRISYEDCFSRAKLILKSVENIHFEMNKLRFNKTLSCGLYHTDISAPISMKNIYKLVDNALFDAKTNGRNQIAIIKPANLTVENDDKAVSLNKTITKVGSCFEYFSCKKMDCIKRKHIEKNCWELEGTECATHDESVNAFRLAFGSKEKTCKLCIYYKLNYEQNSLDS